MDCLTFMMGEFEAAFPVDRHYAKNHMWAEKAEQGYRFGFSSYAVRLLQDVYFLDWYFDAPASVRFQQEIGSIESKKAESSLYAPLTGELIEFNPALMADPSHINLDSYGEGWLFELTESSENEEPLMTAEEYLTHLEKVWIVTQRTIKGQMNS
ncbi:MAG: glycine cleavage system protein H [Pirellulales bacterium]|mgnify:FL=1|jgi:glycine cleavage system H protein|nr:glycine cleavage system protein H [Rhodopirellula sp.]MCH2371078.1 glycine cleavage system protein H [Pirellulales bacterium]|tara:strand:+ start:645 stop:1106 length:462 start_codon:yes stop_codon:yes gene_type:complete